MIHPIVNTLIIQQHLVGGFNPSGKYESQWEGWDPIYYGK